MIEAYCSLPTVLEDDWPTAYLTDHLALDHMAIRTGPFDSSLRVDSDYPTLVSLSSRLESRRKETRVGAGLIGESGIIHLRPVLAPTTITIATGSYWPGSR